MDWTEAAIAQLQSLWAEGHSTAEIGRRMGITKNAVVGKAHRLNLPPRPSPIRREPGANPPRIERRRLPAMRPQLAPLRRPAPPPPVSAAVPPPPPTAIIRAFPRAAQRHCCWPLGDPGTPDFRFCTAEAILGKPYCTDHAAVAYVKPRDRRDDAA